MADNGTDNFFGVVAALAIVVGIVTHSGGGSTTPTGPSGTNTTTTTRSSVDPSRESGNTASSRTNIPGGPLAGCSGTIISEETRANRSGTITLRVYYSTANGGRNCAVATKVGSGLSAPAGPIAINLRFNAYDGRRWPRYARHVSTVDARRSGAVYLVNTDDKCVRATASFNPTTSGPTLKVTSGRVGCD